MPYRSLSVDQDSPRRSASRDATPDTDTALTEEENLEDDVIL